MFLDFNILDILDVILDLNICVRKNATWQLDTCVNRRLNLDLNICVFRFQYLRYYSRSQYLCLQKQKTAQESKLRSQYLQRIKAEQNTRSHTLSEIYNFQGTFTRDQRRVQLTLFVLL